MFFPTGPVCNLSFGVAQPALSKRRLVLSPLLALCRLDYNEPASDLSNFNRTA